MKKTDDDNVLKEKLESLSTLEGGIVFGKDEAWERLQARLDANPRALPHSLVRSRAIAAAAAMLIISSAFAWRWAYTHNETTAVAMHPASAATHIAAEVPAANNPQPVVVATTTITIENHSAVNAQIEKAQPAITVVESLAIEPPPQYIAVRCMAAPAVKQMDIVYAGDLEKINDHRLLTPIPSLPPLIHADLSNLPVSYIGDVEHTEAEVSSLARQAKKPVIRNIFARPEYHEPTPTADQYAQTHKFLKGYVATEN